MKVVSAFAAVAALTAEAGGQDARPRIDAMLVARIEGEVVMPKGARPLSAYRRFYAVTELQQTPVVRGVYVAGASAELVVRFADPVPGVSGAYAMRAGRDVPTIVGGGCSIVETVFDLETMALRAAESERPGARTPTAFCHAEG
jgi:hypothetical protein